MRLPLALYRCAPNGHAFRAPTSFDGYGSLLLRSPRTGALVKADLITDPVFKEIERLLSALPEFERLPEIERGRAMQALFGATCDPDATGNQFVAGASPCCPVCDDCDVSFQSGIEPPEYADIDVPNVSHAGWYRLEPDDRKGVMKEALRIFLHPDDPWTTVP